MGEMWVCRCGEGKEVVVVSVLRLGCTILIEERDDIRRLLLGDRIVLLPVQTMPHRYTCARHRV